MLIVMSTQATHTHTHTHTFELPTHKWTGALAVGNNGRNKKTRLPYGRCISCAAHYLACTSALGIDIHFSVRSKHGRSVGRPLAAAPSAACAHLVYARARARSRLEPHVLSEGEDADTQCKSAQNNQIYIRRERAEYNMYIIKKYAVYAK